MVGWTVDNGLIKERGRGGSPPVPIPCVAQVDLYLALLRSSAFLHDGLWGVHVSKACAPVLPSLSERNCQLYDLDLLLDEA